MSKDLVANWAGRADISAYYQVEKQPAQVKGVCLLLELHYYLDMHVAGDGRKGSFIMGVTCK